MTAAVDHVGDPPADMFSGPGVDALFAATAARFLPDEAPALRLEPFLVSLAAAQAPSPNIDWLVGVLSVQRLTARCPGLDLLPAGIEVRHPVPIEGILASQPHLATLVAEAVGRLRRVFPEDVRFALEIFTDPEARSSEQRMFLLVRTAATPSVAGPLLDRFEAEWWLDGMQQASHMLSIALEFD